MSPNSTAFIFSLYKKHIHNAFIAKKETIYEEEEKENFLNLFMTQRFMSYINTPLVLFADNNTAEAKFHNIQILLAHRSTSTAHRISQ